MKISLIVIIVITLISCNNGRSNEKESDSNFNTVFVDSVNTNFIPLHDKNNIIVDSIDMKNIKITSIKFVLMETSISDSLSCKKWKMTENGIYNILNHVEIIDDIVWFKMYDRHSCSYQGTLVYKQKSYSYTINAASWLTIGDENASVVLGCIKNECLDYFLTKAWSSTED